MEEVKRLHSIRMPVELKSWLAARASKGGRSITSELVQILKAAKKLEAKGPGG